MALHIVTVAFADSLDLASTYASCQDVMVYGNSLAAVHWIFLKRFDEALVSRYPNARVRPSHDTGIYNAMNLAFDALQAELAEEDVVVYLNAGDRFDAEPLAQHVQAHRETKADLSLAAAALTRGGRTMGLRQAPAHPSTSGCIIYSQYPCHQATFYSVAFLRGVLARRQRIFAEEFKACADLDLYLHAQGTCIMTTSFVTSAYDTEGYSAQQSVMVARERAQLVQKYRAGPSWRLYSFVWMLKAQLVAPKRALLRMLGASS